MRNCGPSAIGGDIDAPPETIVRTSDQMGLALRGWRRARGLSQAALGRRIGVHQGRVSQLESTHSDALTMDKLLSACAALGLELVVRPAAHATGNRATQASTVVPPAAISDPW